MQDLFHLRFKNASSQVEIDSGSGLMRLHLNSNRMYFSSLYNPQESAKQPSGNLQKRGGIVHANGHTKVFHWPTIDLAKIDGFSFLNAVGRG